MNIITPIDDPDARATSLDVDARLVDGEAPTLLVDPAECSLLAANAAAVKLLGLVATRPTRMDRAMPAWGIISAVLGGTDKHNQGARPLLFWTPTGPRTIAGQLEAITAGTRSLVRIRLISASTNEASITGAAMASSQPSPGSEAIANANDLATLREIARRIRAGTSADMASQPATTEMPVDTAPPTPRLPPPLDFRPLESPIEPAAATLPPQVPPMATANPIGTDLAKLAHELRTPLSAIVSLAEIMRDERLGAMGNPRYKAYAADIHDSALHTLDLIGVMFDSGGGAVPSNDAKVAELKLDLTRIDLNDIANRCVSAMQPIGARGEVTLGINLQPDLPHLLADRRALRQIILNVLSNALRFTPKGGLIALATVLHADGTIELSVRDTGSGMRTAEIDRALGRSEAPAAPKRIRLAGEQSGFGFGLPLVRQLAEAHGGRLAIESTPGSGTRVAVIFPVDHVMTP
ncbi:MAG: HAMP domain-containing sensor histidine kinase [Hyphomicrobiaceae bacterium]